MKIHSPLHRTRRHAALKQRFRGALDSCFRGALSAIPLGLYERAIPRDVVGLCYHLVADRHPPHVVHVCPAKTPAMFEADLKHLSQRYEVISYDQLLERRADGPKRDGAKRLWKSRWRHRPAVILTFDDGLLECYSVIRPLLLKYELPAVFFITTDFIDNARLFYRHKTSLCIEQVLSLSEDEHHDRLHPMINRLRKTGAHFRGGLEGDQRSLAKWLKSLTYFDESLIDEVGERLGINWRRFLQQRRPYMTASQIQSLAAEGFTIGAHGRTHVRMSLLTDRGEPPTLKEEIAGSCRQIAELVGPQSFGDQVPLAFPFSGDGVCRRWLKSLRAAHPCVGLLFDRRGFQTDERFIVQRIIADKPPQQRMETTLPSLWREAYRRQARAVWPSKKTPK